MNNEQKSTFSYEIDQIILSASKIYEKIKEVSLSMAEETPYNLQDKKCLSLFLGVLKEDNDARNLLNDFDITYQKVIDALSLNLNESKEEKQDYTKELVELVILISDKKSRYYTREISPTDLTSRLLLPHECCSSFFEDVSAKLKLETYSDLINSKLGIMIENKLELEEYNHFEKLNNQEKKRVSIKPELGFTKKKKSLVDNNGILEELGVNPYNVDLSYGRDEEIRKLMVSLLIPNKSAILIGDAGVGKTAIVQGLAHRIAKEDVPEVFLNKKIYSLNVAALVSGCKYVGMFEERLTILLEELSEDKDIILFIDEIHAIVGAGKGSNASNDMANILKPYLDSGKITVIGATTIEEYEDYIKPNTGLKRRFEVVKVKEPDNETLKDICLNVIDKLCLEMGMFFLDDVYIQDEVIECLINLTDSKHRHYLDKVNNPDLIVSLLTRSFALAKFYNKEIVEISDLIEAIDDNERIYEVSKARIINSLRKLSNSEKKIAKKIKGARIIEFPSKH